MRTDVIGKALGRKLDEANLGLHIVWENEHIPPGQKLPYLIFEYVPVSRRDRSLAGGSARAQGFAQITVVSEKGQFATEGRRIAEDVAAVFDRADPARQQIIGEGVKIIIGDSAVQRSYPDAKSWRTPVQINVTAMKA